MFEIEIQHTRPHFTLLHGKSLKISTPLKNKASKFVFKFGSNNKVIKIFTGNHYYGNWKTSLELENVLMKPKAI